MTKFKINIITIDLNSDKDNPYAIFQIIKNRNKHNDFVHNIKYIKIRYSAIIYNKLEFIVKKSKAELNRKGYFRIIIPQQTLEIKFDINIIFDESQYNNIKYTHYEPYYVKSDFNGNNIDLKLVLKQLNKLAIDTTGLDHTHVQPGEDRIYGQQLGPTRSSRAMAIVHLAIWEAYNSIEKLYKSNIGLEISKSNLNVKIAMCQAAYESLIYLYSSHVSRLKPIITSYIKQIGTSYNTDDSIKLGYKAAKLVIEKRKNDGSDIKDPICGVDYKLSDNPRYWTIDPISQDQIALGAYWYKVDPFCIQSSNQFRSVPFPEMNNVKFICQYEETKSMGGDDINTLSVRTQDDTNIGIYWAYDGTPSLCAPPRLYNQLVNLILTQENIKVSDYFRILTLLNISMADAAIACWESKYYYKIGRPITVIRNAYELSNNIIEDRSFIPLGSPGSNTTSPNFTPPFPSYPSGHATFGGVVFQLLRKVLNQDDITFTFTSDEFNGITKDNDGNVRPLITRTFQSLSQAEEENGQSRIYLGIHWSDDKKKGIQMGNDIANYIWDNYFVHL